MRVSLARAQFLLTPISRGHIMGMAEPVYYSAEMVRELPDDGKRCETVHGDLLVTPAPCFWLQEVVTRIVEQLRAHLRRHPCGHALQLPADISQSPDTLVQPDLFVVDLDEARTGDWSRMKNLLLVVQVFSPGTARQNRFAKRRLYQEVGVPLYWIVDPDQKAVDVWTPEAQFPSFERERIVWKPKSETGASGLDLEELFKPI